MDGALHRTRAFELALAGRSVDVVEPFPGGASYRTPSLAAVWDLNFLWVADAAGAEADDLARTADRLQGETGLAHRRVVVPGERNAERLAPRLQALGWTAERLLTMVAGETPEPRRAVAVEEVAFERLLGLRAELAREGPGGRSPAVVEQLLTAAARHARAGSARHFAVLDEGRPVAAADLYSDGRTAQVEDVATLTTHRGRGYASAIVLRAVEAARETGNDLVFLLADADDWPQELYRRLGFEPIGDTHTFTRPSL